MNTNVPWLDSSDTSLRANLTRVSAKVLSAWANLHLDGPLRQLARVELARRRLLTHSSLPRLKQKRLVLQNQATRGIGRASRSVAPPRVQKQSKAKGKCLASRNAVRIKG